MNHFRLNVVALVSIMAQCHASMLDFSWYHPIDSSNVVECEVRTAIFDGSNDRHVTKRRCEAYLDEDGESKGILFDIPQWIVDKYHRSFKQRPRTFLRIEGARFARLNASVASERLRLSKRSHDEILVDVRAKIEVSNEPFTDRRSRRRVAAMSGNSNVLVVRVSTVDGIVALDASAISARVFGSYGTPASQYKACSMGKKRLVPATGPGITGGVLEMAVESEIEGISAGDFENILNTVLSTMVASLDDYNHIIYCLPDGSLGSLGERDWIAYAYIDWNRAYFNGDACRYLSNYVHELGHNMGLGHSGKDGSVYGDQSGIMGVGYERESWPLVCFNGAKNWQLGWYSDKVIELQARSSCGPWKGRLYGFTDFLSVPDRGFVLVKVGDIFMQFNKIAAMNRDTQEKSNMIAFTLSTGDVNSISWSLDGRTSGTFEYETVRVDICGSFLDNGLEYFDIVVRNQTQASICNSAYSPECSPIAPSRFPVIPPSTPSNMLIPTLMPMALSPIPLPPTPLPSRSPTRMPTSQLHTPDPTKAPTSLTTRSPTLGLTTRPQTQNPTKPSTSLPPVIPTPMPTTRLPTRNPTNPPTPLPTKSPTPLPTTGPPTQNPTKSTQLPTWIPTPLSTTRPPTLIPTNPATSAPTKSPTPSPTTGLPIRTPTTPPIPLPRSTLHPTKSQTLPPTRSPTEAPTTRPFTQKPTTMPTKANTVNTICDDNLLGKFLFPGADGYLRERDCMWLRARAHLTKEVCSTSIEASSLCEETCGKCVDNCFDSRHQFVYQGLSRSCSWLSVRLGVINEVCHSGHNAYMACPETCGACDV